MGSKVEFDSASKPANLDRADSTVQHVHHLRRQNVNILMEPDNSGEITQWVFTTMHGVLVATWVAELHKFGLILNQWLGSRLLEVCHLVLHKKIKIKLKISSKAPACEANESYVSGIYWRVGWTKSKIQMAKVYVSRIFIGQFSQGAFAHLHTSAQAALNQRLPTRFSGTLHPLALLPGSLPRLQCVQATFKKKSIILSSSFNAQSIKLTCFSWRRKKYNHDFIIDLHQ